jgi:DNA-binding IclR family transcriptional regulator
MSVSWPLFRFNHEEKELIVNSILEECDNLSRLLGWQRD